MPGQDHKPPRVCGDQTNMAVASAAIAINFTAAWKAVRSATESARLANEQATGDEPNYDAVFETLCETDNAIIMMPAPDLDAVRIKIDLVRGRFGVPQEIDGQYSAIVADLVRLWPPLDAEGR